MSYRDIIFYIVLIFYIFGISHFVFKFSVTTSIVVTVITLVFGYCFTIVFAIIMAFIVYQHFVYAINNLDDDSIKDIDTDKTTNKGDQND